MAEKKTGWQKQREASHETSRGRRPPAEPKTCSNCYETGHTAPRCPNAGPVPTFDDFERLERVRRTPYG